MFAQFVATQERGRPNSAFNKAMSDMIRAGRHAEAEERLRLLIDGAPSSALKGAIISTTADDLEFRGWSQLMAIMTESPRAGPITAIGVDISGHSIDGGMTRDGSMAFEVGYYTDAPFAFSQMSRDKIFAESETYGRKWQGGFADVRSDLQISGLSNIATALRPMFQPDRSGNEQAIQELSYWWVILIIDEALTREIKAVKPPRQVPLILGTHDFGPDINVVHYWTP